MLIALNIITTEMNNLKHILTIAIFAILVLGCSAPYYGYTKEEWSQLSESEQASIKKEYQTIIDSRSEQAHMDKINDRTNSVIELGVSHPDR